MRGRVRTLAEVERLDPRQLAFFLDVDGTLLEIAPTPDEVTVTPSLIGMLRALSLRTGGAVALVSGRSIAVLDDLFAPLLLPAAGPHGFERRGASGAYFRHALPPGPALDLARKHLQRLVECHEGLLLEDKRFALALHYRLAPALEATVVNEVEAVAHAVGSGLTIQHGQKVVELRPACSSKGTAVAQFMDESPFRGRLPVCFGDDLTDEAAFEWTNGAGGLSVAVNVGRTTAAMARLPSVAAVRNWLNARVDPAIC